MVSYQVENGIYNKYVKTTLEEVSENVETIKESINLLQKSILAKQKKVEGLYNELASSKNEIQNLISQKTQELELITQNLSTSNVHTNQIGDLLNKGTEQAARLNSIIEQQDQNKAAADKKLQELQELYNTTNEKLLENITSINIQLKEFEKQNETNNEHLKFIEGKRDFFEERITYLDNLIGREVGVSLFETFKQRKIELNKPVIFWRWAVPVMSIATVIWILCLFSGQSDVVDNSLWWQSFALNTIKSIPVILLLLFSINQYRKERNFQEEYAFKSAVALTIDAYSNRITDTSNKDKWIMEAVNGIYKTPIEEAKKEKSIDKRVTDMATKVINSAGSLKGKP